MSAARQRAHRWQPIADLPGYWPTWRSGLLTDLVQKWLTRRHALEQSAEGQAAVRIFLERLVRSWSIETGILERIYTLDESITRTLVERGFEAAYIGHGDSDLPAEELLRILADHREAAEGLFAFVKGQRQLSASYVCELHQVLLRHQIYTEAIDPQGNRLMVPVRKGAWKELPNNPSDATTGAIVHEYCPPLQVADEMERLLTLHHEHKAKGVPFDVEAAWLHHRFTQIHPFQDGNGRVARALATLVCLRAGALPLVVPRELRAEYIDALERADAGDLLPLVELFRSLQQQELLRVLQVQESPGAAEGSVQGILEAARRKLANAWLPVDPSLADYARQLENLAVASLQGVAREFERLAPTVAVNVLTASEGGLEFVTAIETMARTCGYELDPERLYGCATLTIVRQDQAHGMGRTLVAISIHGVRRTAVGAAIAFVQVAKNGSQDPPVGHTVGSRNAFAFTAASPFEEEGARFAQWLEESIQRCLGIWRDSL